MANSLLLLHAGAQLRKAFIVLHRGTNEQTNKQMNKTVAIYQETHFKLFSMESQCRKKDRGANSNTKQSRRTYNEKGTQMLLRANKENIVMKNEHQQNIYNNNNKKGTDMQLCTLQMKYLPEKRTPMQKRDMDALHIKYWSTEKKYSTGVLKSQFSLGHNR